MILIIRYATVIGSVLRSLREAAGITQAEVEQRSGLAASMVSSYERSVVTPNIDSAARVLDATGWQLCALPTQIAATFEAREAVIEAARKAEIHVGGNPDLFRAIDALEAAEKREHPPLTERNPAHVYLGLRATVDEQQAELIRLRQALADVRRILGEVP